MTCRHSPPAAEWACPLCARELEGGARTRTVARTMGTPGPPFTDVGSLYPQIIRYADQIVSDQRGAVTRSAALARIAHQINDMAITEAHAEQGTTPEPKDPADA